MLQHGNTSECTSEMALEHKLKCEGDYNQHHIVLVRTRLELRLPIGNGVNTRTDRTKQLHKSQEAAALP